MPNSSEYSYLEHTDNRVIETDYREDCEADMDLVDLVNAVEMKGYIL